MKSWIGIVGVALVLLATSAIAEETAAAEKAKTTATAAAEACQTELLKTRALSGGYSNDYHRAKNELAQAQYELYIAKEKIKMLEGQIKKEKPAAEKAEEKKDEAAK